MSQTYQAEKGLCFNSFTTQVGILKSRDLPKVTQASEKDDRELESGSPGSSPGLSPLHKLTISNSRAQSRESRTLEKSVAATSSPNHRNNYNSSLYLLSSYWMLGLCNKTRVSFITALIGEWRNWSCETCPGHTTAQWVATLTTRALWARIGSWYPYAK